MRSFNLQLLAAVSFALDYRDGGSRWDDNNCKYGKQQSPIDIHMVSKNENLDLYLNQGYNYYSEGSGKTIYIEEGWDESFVLGPVKGDEIVPGTKKASTVGPSGETHEWVPYFMVFKAPSEHTFEGRQTDLELQFYHRTPEGMYITEERNDWDGRRLDGMLMATSIFFDRLHGGNEDHPFIESLELDS